LVVMRTVWPSGVALAACPVPFQHGELLDFASLAKFTGYDAFRARQRGFGRHALDQRYCSCCGSTA
jgi:hypothetical protein